MQTEVEGFRQCNSRDGAALCRYFAWLEEALAKGEKWSEFDAATQLESFRRCAALVSARYDPNIHCLDKMTSLWDCHSVQFRRLEPMRVRQSSHHVCQVLTPLSAMIHYQATEDNTAVIDRNQIYLCDSGAQYLDGTTDTTRTLVSALQCSDVT